MGVDIAKLRALCSRLAESADETWVQAPNDLREQIAEALDEIEQLRAELATPPMLRPLTPQQIEDALNEGRAESMAARGDNAWTALLAERDQLRARLADVEREFAEFRAQTCALGDRLMRERDEARDAATAAGQIIAANAEESRSARGELRDALAVCRTERDALRKQLADAQAEYDRFRSAAKERLHYDMQDTINGPHSRANIERETAERIARHFEHHREPHMTRERIAEDIRERRWDGTGAWRRDGEGER